jgi:uncharacterized protein YydD (DUF2326 family)
MIESKNKHVQEIIEWFESIGVIADGQVVSHPQKLAELINQISPSDRQEIAVAITSIEDRLIELNSDLEYLNSEIKQQEIIKGGLGQILKGKLEPEYRNPDIKCQCD